MGNKQDKIGRDYLDWVADYKPRPAVYGMKRNHLLDSAKLVAVISMIYVSIVLVMAL